MVYKYFFVNYNTQNCLRDLVLTHTHIEPCACVCMCVEKERGERELG